MRRLVLALFVLLPLVAFTRIGSPQEVDAGVTADVEFLLDCDTTAAGIQASCVSAPGTTRDVAFVVKNNGASTVRLGTFAITVLNPNVSRLSAPMIPGPPFFDVNPDADPAVSLVTWACSPPDPTNDTGADGNPSTQQSFIDCRTGTGDGPDLAPGSSQTIAVVHYNIPMMATPGAVSLSIEGAFVGDETYAELGSCPGGSLPATCTGATITIPALSIVVDCNMTQPGIQSKCYVSNMMTIRHIDIVFRNHTMAPIQLGAFNSGLLNSDITRFNAPAVDNSGDMDDNPDAHANVMPVASWDCSPPNPENDTGADGDPNTQESFITCFNGSNNGPNVMQMNYLAVSTVRYAIPAGADPGSLFLTPMLAEFQDNTFTERGSCNPTVTVVMLCQPAEVILYCPIEQADVVGTDGRVNSGDIGKVASVFGQMPAPVNEDQNWDGIINSGDLGLVASVFNKYVTECP